VIQVGQVDKVDRRDVLDLGERDVELVGEAGRRRGRALLPWRPTIAGGRGDRTGFGSAVESASWGSVKITRRMVQTCQVSPGAPCRPRHTRSVRGQ
jgi:hypothetical protein